MKIRYGFVSNSSSSSFILVVSVEDHCVALNSLSSLDQRMMQSVLCGIKPTQIGNTQVMVITGGDYEEGWNRGNLQDYEAESFGFTNDYDDWDKAREFWENYVAAIPQNKYHYEWKDR